MAEDRLYDEARGPLDPRPRRTRLVGPPIGVWDDPTWLRVVIDEEWMAEADAKATQLKQSPSERFAKQMMRVDRQNEPARVLVIEGDFGLSRDVVSSLSTSGLLVEVVAITQVPNVDVLKKYSSVTLVGVDRQELSAEQLAAISRRPRKKKGD